MLMISVLINWIISAMVIFSVAYVLPGVHILDFTVALVVALVLGILNALVKPVLFVLTLPITIITLGLFAFVLNALLILFVSSIVPGFKIDGFIWAFIFAIILSVANFVVHKFLP